MTTRGCLLAAAAGLACATACGGTANLDARRTGRGDAVGGGGSTPTTNAVFTTTNPDVDGSGHCQNGNEGVNCNQYDAKEHVWLSGGPLTGNSGLENGTYFFAVLVPGGQGGNDNPNDGTPLNLSDVAPTSGTGAGDPWTDRVFTLTDGVLGYDGPHDFSDNKIRLMGFDDTTNPGGVYILAVCSVADGYPVDPSDCKFDAFKVTLADLEVAIDDPLYFDETFTWTLEKLVDRTLVKQAGGDAAFQYTVIVTHDEGTTSNWWLEGVVSIANRNGVDITADVAIGVNSTGVWTCTPATTTVTVLPETTFSLEYSCAFTGEGTPPDGTVATTVSWVVDGEPRQETVSDPLDFANAIGTRIDECVAVVDSQTGDLGAVCVGGPNPRIFNYDRAVTGVAGTCIDSDNTASATTNDTDMTVTGSTTVTVCTGADLVVSKDAKPQFVRSYAWDIDKRVDPELVKQVGGSAELSYNVDVAQTAVIDSNWVITGQIAVTNPNDWQAIPVTVTDVASGGGCIIYTDFPVEIPAGTTRFFDYACGFESGASGTNTAVATWDEAEAFTPSGSAAGTADFAFTTPTTRFFSTVTVGDSYAGFLGTVVGTDEPPYAQATYSYVRVEPMPTWDCVSVDNTATITETGQAASALATLCGPIHTGARTIGFWQNKNGQRILLAGAATAGVCDSGNWLRQFAPFQDLASTATCTQVASYATTVIKAASAAGPSMNPMLKAQMLATALDVFFSDPSLGGNKLLAPAPIGGVDVDLTLVCRDLSCVDVEDTSPVFGDAPSLTVLEMLVAAAGASNPRGSLWYDNDKSTQELAKDAFDAVNNERVFAP
jgi:hypothetical protein